MEGRPARGNNPRQFQKAEAMNQVSEPSPGHFPLPDLGKESPQSNTLFLPSRFS